MTLIAALFLVGVILLGIEVFVPGGVLGVCGGLALFGGCVLAFLDHGAGGGALAVLVALALVVAMLVFEFGILPKTPMGKRLFLNASVSGKTAPQRDPGLVGRSGRTVTALAPSGYVLIQGRQHEAFSRAGFLDADVAVKVVGFDNFRLIVIPESPN